MKYIIDIEDQAVNGLYKAKNFKTLVFDGYGLDRLEKYDDALADNTIKAAYREGMDRAWETARKIACFTENGGLSCEELSLIFWNDCAPEILLDHTAEEAEEKIRSFEEKEDEIRIGDEVIAEDGDARFIVTHIANDIAGIDQEGNVYAYLPEEIDGKTGMHYSILEALRGTPFMMTCFGHPMNAEQEKDGE